uniref:Nuclear receptor domain-containing protein n=1 Tax=Globodera rostochiensis TaxID=31243 RepID=A0A914GTI8_GLORO
MADLVTTNSAGPSTSGGEDQLQKAQPANVCVVCGDESDGRPKAMTESKQYASSIASSVSKQASSVSKQASSVSKQAVLASKQASSVSKQASKQAVLASKQAVLASKQASSVSKQASSVSKQASSVSKQASSVSKQASKQAVLASKQAVLASKQAVLASKQAVLASKQAVLASKQASSVSKQASKQASSVSKQASSVSKQASSVSKQAVLASKQAVLASKQAVLASKQAVLASKQSSKQAVLASKQAVLASKQASSVSKQASSVSKQASSVSKQASSVSKQVSSVSKQASSVSKQASKQAVLASKQASSVSKQASKQSSKQAVLASKQAVLASKQASSVSKQASSVSKQASSVSKQASSVSKQASSVSKQASSVSKQQASKQAVLASKQASSVSKQASSVSKQASSVSKQASSVSKQAVLASKQASSVSKQASSVSKQASKQAVLASKQASSLHFGRFTCRACAAFFRRTVSLKLQYKCKRQGNCEVDKAARNMCRACRYQKCLQQGMLTTAVQHSRDGIGKRSRSGQRERVFISSSHTPGDAKMPRGTSETKKQTQFLGIGYGRAQSPSSSSTILLDQASTAATILQLNAVSGQISTTSTFGPQQQHYTGEFGGGVLPPYIMGNFPNLLGQQPAGGSVNLGGHGSLQMTAQLQQQQCTSSAVAVELKYLRRMLDGYHHFLSLRKASYTLVDGFPLSRRDNEDCPQSNFGTSKKICKIEASLIMDIVEKFFHPFSQLPTDDKHKLFNTYYCLFSNAERAFRTYKMFGADDDRLLMPDGGYVRLSELQKFYENNTLVRGDPSQVAKIFENAMHYLVKTVVAHMRHIELSEMELIALFGIFIWSDSEEISHESLQTALQGLSEAEVTLKTANVFLLIPKLELSVKLMMENFCISELFNLMNLGGGACNSKGSITMIRDRAVGLPPPLSAHSSPLSRRLPRCVRVQHDQRLLGLPGLKSPVVSRRRGRKAKRLYVEVLLKMDRRCTFGTGKLGRVTPRGAGTSSGARSLAAAVVECAVLWPVLFGTIR